jgi:DNA polymerase III delta prime subunit
VYENIIGQDEVCKTLAGEIIRGSLPPALLFSGPVASGKLTTALETARLLSCREKGAWNCACPDCAMHRRLGHPDLLLFGARSLPEEISVAKEFIFRNPCQASAYFFLRSLAKLSARFNPALWTSEESRLGKAAALVESMNEAADRIDPATIGSKLDSETVKAVESAYTDALALGPLVPEAPVFMLRNMRIWAQLAPMGKRRTVIIENADKMQDSARNAMLKILEEPPDTVRFILLTSRRASMLATVLSRARLYSFSPRDEKTSALVLQRVLKTDERAESLTAFYESRLPFSPGQARVLAEKLIGKILFDAGWEKEGLGEYGQSLIDLAADSSQDMDGILIDVSQQTKGFGARDKALAGSFIRFLRALTVVFTSLLQESMGNKILLTMIDRCSTLIRDAAIQYSSYNRNPEFLSRLLVASFKEHSVDLKNPGFHPEFSDSRGAIEGAQRP